MAIVSIKVLAEAVSGLKQAMESVKNEAADNIGKWVAALSYAREYNDLARTYFVLTNDRSIKTFDDEGLKKIGAGSAWPMQKSLFNNVFTMTLILNNVISQFNLEPIGQMYNLLVSGSEDSWQGRPFQIEMSRCIREYTSSSITARYGALDEAALVELKRAPCIFAYEVGCNIAPKLGFIRDVTARQEQVRIEYSLYPVDPFLSAAQLQEIEFRIRHR
jgi:hypothetical protein